MASLPSSTAHSPTPTVVPNVFVDALSPTPTPCCQRKEVVVVISTTLLIPDYYRYYDTPLDSFRPRYFALADGSLITSPFIHDLRSANLSLLVTGILAMLFARNIIVSGDYIRRGKVKKKGLFWMLFLSQLVAPASFIPRILPYFNQFMACTG